MLSMRLDNDNDATVLHGSDGCTSSNGNEQVLPQRERVQVILLRLSRSS